MNKNIKPIYLDYAATTPVDPRVLEEMIPWFTEKFGNPASRTHDYGVEAEKAVRKARKQVAGLIGSKPEEIVFTSGATEGINLLIKGVFEANHQKGKHIITVSTEHKAVLDTCQYLESQGAEVTYLPVNRDGLIDLEHLSNAIRNDSILVSVMFANNETGVIQPIDEIAKICKGHAVYFMSDATQAVGKIPINVNEMGIDLMTMSAHKLYGPKGVGAVFVRQQYPKINITPLIHGGGHEKGFRSGTLNVPGIVGLGKAAELAAQEMNEEAQRLREIRESLENAILEIEGTKINGHPKNRLPHIINIAFEGVDAEALIMRIRDELAIANGSACTSAEISPSHVLKAMNFSDDRVYSSVRFGFGKMNKLSDITTIRDVIIKSIYELKLLTAVTNE